VASARDSPQPAEILGARSGYFQTIRSNPAPGDIDGELPAVVVPCSRYSLPAVSSPGDRRQLATGCQLMPIRMATSCQLGLRAPRRPVDAWRPRHAVSLPRGRVGLIGSGIALAAANLESGAARGEAVLSGNRHLVRQGAPPPCLRHNARSPRKPCKRLKGRTVRCGRALRASGIRCRGPVLVSAVRGRHRQHDLLPWHRPCTKAEA
jgi:hypothetical protein